MGFSLSWLAVKGMPPELVRAGLGFIPTGRREAFPEAQLSAVELPDGWYLIVANRNERVTSEAALQGLSASGGELVTCSVEEHAMVSQAAAWKDGRLSWSVTHDAQRSRDHLETRGEPPSEYGPILRQMKTKQQEADASNRRVDFILEVPVELARHLVGYRYDSDIPGLTGDVFEELTRTAPESFERPGKP